MSVFVVDASVVVSAAFKADNVPRRALLAARAHGTIALSTVVEIEVVEVLARPKFAKSVSPMRAEEVRYLLSGAAIWVTPTIGVQDCRDPKDNRYLELALAAGASAIISGDDDLLVLDPWRKIRILRPADFLAWVTAARDRD